MGKDLTVQDVRQWCFEQAQALKDMADRAPSNTHFDTYMGARLALLNVTDHITEHLDGKHDA